MTHEQTLLFTAAGPYSQAIKAANQIWVAGQIPADTTGNLIEGTITDKTRQCCKNIKAVLEAAGSGIDKVVRVGVRVHRLRPLFACSSPATLVDGT